jgi:Flp pilus assembly protein TadG
MIEKSRSNSGQALVEFALILPILIIIILGIADFGIALYDKAMVTNASREGARAGIVFRSTVDAKTNIETYIPHTQPEIDAVVKNYLASKLITFGTGSIDDWVVTGINLVGVSPNWSGGNGTFDVSVTYTHKYLVIPKFIGMGSTVNIGAETIMRLE